MKPHIVLFSNTSSIIFSSDIFNNLMRYFFKKMVMVTLSGFCNEKLYKMLRNSLFLFFFRKSLIKCNLQLIKKIILRIIIKLFMNTSKNSIKNSSFLSEIKIKFKFNCEFYWIHFQALPQVRIPKKFLQVLFQFFALSS